MKITPMLSGSFAIYKADKPGIITTNPMFYVIFTNGGGKKGEGNEKTRRGGGGKERKKEGKRERVSLIKR